MVYKILCSGCAFFSFQRLENVEAPRQARAGDDFDGVASDPKAGQLSH